MASIGQYLRETRAELRHVAWPTRAQTISFTILVIAISVGVALYLGVFDYLFSQSLASLIHGAGASPIQVDQTATGTMPVAPTFSATSTE